MIYLDVAATMPMHPDVSNYVDLINKIIIGNPSANSSVGKDAKHIIDSARQIIANKLDCDAENIFFTSGATEANNWVLEAHAKPGSRIVVSAIEHPSIINKCKELESRGVEVVFIPVDSSGNVDLVELLENIAESSLVSIMWANNEIGTIQDIRRISLACNAAQVPLHTDATQAFCKINIHPLIDGRYTYVEEFLIFKAEPESYIDFMSISSHKIGGPKGVGALYVKKPEDFKPMIYGGGQESGLRSGTENVAGIAGFGKAVELSRDVDKYITHQKRLQILDGIKNIENIKINGNSHSRVPGIISVTIDGIDGDALVEMLDEECICISTGSACHNNSGEPSHVLKAIGLSDDEINSTIRISFDHTIEDDEIKEFITVLTHCINVLRGI